MSVTNKFLYLDSADEPAAEKAVESEPCCCEASLTDLIAAIRECGQNPVTQLSGYLITEDPTYLPEGVSSRGVSARSIARRVGRDKLLATLIELYLNSCTDLE